MTLDEQQYEALATLARQGVAGDPVKQRELDSYLTAIEAANGITRFFLFVMWSELGRPVPNSARFPEKWPPELMGQIVRYDRAIVKQDVLDYVARSAYQTANILVTKDPAGLLGWQKLDDFFR